MDEPADPLRLYRVVGIRHDGQRVHIIGGLNHGTAKNYSDELTDMESEFKHFEVEPVDR